MRIRGLPSILSQMWKTKMNKPYLVQRGKIREQSIDGSSIVGIEW